MKEFSYVPQGCIYLIKYSKTVILWNIITISNNSFLFEYILDRILILKNIYSCNGKATFTPGFSVT